MMPPSPLLPAVYMFVSCPPLPAPGGHAQWVAPQGWDAEAADSRGQV